MERVLSWLNQPLFPDTVIRVWMAVAAGAALLLALILAFFLIRRKKKKKRVIRRWKNRLRNVRNRCRNWSLPTYRALAAGRTAGRFRHLPHGSL